MRHLWKKPFKIKCLSPVQGCKTPESNMSLGSLRHTTPR